MPRCISPVSSNLSVRELESVREALSDAAGRARGQPEDFRGGPWTLLVTSPALAWRVGVFVRAWLLAQGLADPRMAIGSGEVENLSSLRTSLSTGEACRLSGQAWDRMAMWYPQQHRWPQRISGRTY